MIGTKVVCAACKLDDGMILAGARHYSPNMRLQAKLMYGDDFKNWPKEVEQGFLDNMDNFLSRADAAILAYESGQIKELMNIIFSEDLY